jgi:hypothetical protein
LSMLVSVSGCSAPSTLFLASITCTPNSSASSHRPPRAYTEPYHCHAAQGFFILLTTEFFSRLHPRLHPFYQRLLCVTHISSVHRIGSEVKARYLLGAYVVLQVWRHTT